MPPFYAGDLLGPPGKTPLYLGQPVALLIFERTDAEPRLVGACGLNRRPSGAVERFYETQGRSPLKEMARHLAINAGQSLNRIARAKLYKAYAGGLVLDRGTDAPALVAAVRDRLMGQQGAAFDRAYMQEMVTDHTQDVAEFEKASRTASDPDVQAFVERLEQAAQEEEGHLDPSALPSGDVLAREFQRFLRQRGNEPPKPPR